MATPNHPTEQAPDQAPFDPRRAERTPPPPQPSAWLEPVSEADEVSDQPAPDEPIVLEDDVAEPTDPIDPVTGATPAGITGQRRGSPRRTRKLVKPDASGEPTGLNAQQRLLVLDAWKRSGLPAGDFAPLVGLSRYTLYAWKSRFEEEGPAGLMDRPRGGPKGSRVPDITKRAIIMMKESNPDWGVQKISDLLLRGPGLAASPGAVAKVLKEWGYELEEVPTRPHPDKVRHFERARPNQLWQTDLFTFILKRQNQRVYLVVFLDDHSRFIVSYGLHASQSAALVLEVVRAGIASYGTPEEILTDNGTQYVTWRGQSQFAQECQKRGIKHIVASPRHPQTLGKTERFWGTLWRECVESAVFTDLGDARARIGHFIDHYNFQRPHQGIESAVPADRFFGAAPTMLATLKERVAGNALSIAREGAPKAPFYLAGNVGGKAVSVHAAGDRLVLTTPNAQTEVTLADVAPAQTASPLPDPVAPSGAVASGWTGADGPQAPGVSPLDDLGFDAASNGGAL
jgi:transposase InsO family protein